MAWSDEKIALLKLGISDEALSIIDGRGRYTDFLQEMHNLGLAAFPRPGGQQHIQFLLMYLTALAVFESLVCQPLGMTYCLAEVLPFPFVVHRNRHPLVLSLAAIHIVGGHDFIVISLPPPISLIHEVIHDRFREHCRDDF